MSGIVISYRREDTEGSAGRLYDRLVARYGADFVFMDFSSIEPSDDWLQTIDTTVASGNLVLALIGPRWLSASDDTGRRRLDADGDYVRREIRTAAEHSVRLLPVLVHGASMVGAGSLPHDIQALSDVQPVILDSRHYERDVEQLYRLIDGVLGFGDEIPRWDRQRTAVAGFVGLAPRGPIDEPTLVTKWSQFEYVFGGYEPGRYLAHAAYGWFHNGGSECYVVRVGDDSAMEDLVGNERGLRTLERVEEVTIVAAPDVVGLYQHGSFGMEQVLAAQYGLIAHCEWIGNRLAILDPLPGLNAQQMAEFTRDAAKWDSPWAALYYPWVQVYDPDSGRMISVPPCGHIAGAWAQNDRDRGTWSPPANLTLQGVVNVSEPLTRDEVFLLQKERVNLVRGMPGQGIRVWGSRTLTISSRFTDIGTARMIGALGVYVGEATSWAAFERSNVRTWNRLQTSVEIVLESLWRQGAFAGGTAAEAFYVKCDEKVNVHELAAAGKIHVEFGFALTVPGNFIRMRIEQPGGDVTLYSD